MDWSARLRCMLRLSFFCFYKQKTAYEMRISDWSSDVCSSDLPMFGISFRIWGYESNWGSFAQFTKVQGHQCMPKASHLTWEAAAAPTLVGSTAYRIDRKSVG